MIHDIDPNHFLLEQVPCTLSAGSSVAGSGYRPREPRRVNLLHIRRLMVDAPTDALKGASEVIKDILRERTNK
jgi:hypothetical protein